MQKRRELAQSILYQLSFLLTNGVLKPEVYMRHQRQHTCHQNMLHTNEFFLQGIPLNAHLYDYHQQLLV